MKTGRGGILSNVQISIQRIEKNEKTGKHSPNKGKISRTSLTEIAAYELLDKKLKTLNIKMLNNLRRKVHEESNNFNKEKM